MACVRGWSSGLTTSIVGAGPRRRLLATIVALAVAGCSAGGGPAATTTAESLAPAQSSAPAVPTSAATPGAASAATTPADTSGASPSDGSEPSLPALPGASSARRNPGTTSEPLVSASPSDTPPPTQPPTPAVRAWVTSTVAGSSLFGASVAGDRLFVFGGHGKAAAIWSSVDGTGWSSGSGLPPGWIMGLAAGPDGLVAVGCAAGTTASPCGGPVVVRSADGNAWTRVRLPSSLGITALDRVVYAFGRYVATGTTCWAAVSASCATRMAVITSTDGLAWTAAALPDDRAYSADAIVATEGRLGIAGGPSIWTTTDGRTWRKDALATGGAS